MRAWLSLVAIAFLSLTTEAALAAEKRVALVIGNSAYPNARLTNPFNDATGMVKALQGLGFEVIAGFDLTKSDMERRISEFAARLDDADVGLLFYAGHGLQVAQKNYLVPVDARLSDEASVDFEAIPVAFVRKPMELKAKKTLILLDACRDNPLVRSLRRSLGTRSLIVGQGLVEEDKGLDTFISFSVQPGGQADDGSGTNSPYTGALLRHIATPGQSTSDLMINIRKDMLKETRKRQNPWSTDSLTEPFYFVPGQAGEASGLPKVRIRPVINACDRLAANPSDPRKIGPGVPAEAIDVKWAIPACLEAAQQFPDEPRFAYQLGRAFMRFKQCERAKPQFEAAVARNYAIAFNELGLLYTSGCGTSVPKDDAAAVVLYKKGAELGVLPAQFNLALRHAGGRGVPKDEAEALRLYTAAADAGYPSAKRELARRYGAGLGVTKSEETAVRLLREAASAGDWTALSELATRFKNGRGVTKDEVEAARLYRQAAKDGSPDALNLLGTIHEYGRGVPKNLTEAARYYRQASDAGSAAGTYNLANMHYSGRGVAFDRQESARLYRLAVEEGGHTEAMRRLAAMLERGAGVPRNDAEAFRLYKMSAGNNHYSALNLAQMLFTGRGTARDEAEAARLRTKVAEMTDPIALGILGEMHLSGDEAPRDDAEALRLAQRATQLGDKDGMLLLSQMYYRGTGTAKQEAEAERLRQEYEKASTAGYELSRLATLYETGDGVPSNATHAARLYALAYGKGWEYAGIDLAGLLYSGPDDVKNLAEAEKIRTSLADTGKSYAVLAGMYENGKKAPKNEAEAIALYRKAAAADDANALLPLARMLHDGRGADKDEAEAAKLRDRVATGSSVSDIKKLGDMYATGIGAPKQEQKALELYRRASDLGNRWAMIALAAAIQDGRGTSADASEAIDIVWEAVTGGPVTDRHIAVDAFLQAKWSDEVRRALKRRLWEANVYAGSPDPAFGADATEALRKLARTATSTPQASGTLAGRAP